MIQHTFRLCALVVAVSALAALTLLRDAQPRPHAIRPATCTHYAAPAGDDAARGTERRPFRSAQRLVDSLRPGETGCLRAGTYHADAGRPVVRFGRTGLPGRRIMLRSYPGERAKLVGIVTVPRGSDHVTIARLTIEGTGRETTMAITANDTIVQRNHITNAWRGASCMLLGDNADGGEAARPIVRRNRFHECGSPANGNKDHAIYAANAVDGRIVDNVFWNTAAYAIHLYPNARRTYVTRNVIDGGAPSVRGGVLVGGDSSYASSNNLIERNVVAYSRTSNVESWWESDTGSGNVVRSNCLWGGKDENVDTSNGGFAAVGNIVAQPFFRNRHRRDYRLQALTGCKRVVPLTAGSLAPVQP